MTGVKVAAFWEYPENIWSKFSNIQKHSGKIFSILSKIRKTFSKFWRKFEIWERYKGVHCV